MAVVVFILPQRAEPRRSCPRPGTLPKVRLSAVTLGERRLPADVAQYKTGQQVAGPVVHLWSFLERSRDEQTRLQYPQLFQQDPQPASFAEWEASSTVIAENITSG